MRPVRPISDWQRLSMISDTAGFLMRYNRLGKDQAWAVAERLVDEAIAQRERTGGDVTISVSTDMFPSGVRERIAKPRDSLRVEVQARPKPKPEPLAAGRFANLDLTVGD